VTERWFGRVLPDTIKLPGSLPAPKVLAKCCAIYRHRQRCGASSSGRTLPPRTP
jgi:hypothetical protein